MPDSRMVSAQSRALDPAAAISGPAPTPEKIGRVAAEFEALLIAQMLKSAKEAGSRGWLGLGEDESADSLAEIALERFAALLAERGGLGLADLIINGLRSPAGSEDTADKRAGNIR